MSTSNLSVLLLMLLALLFVLKRVRRPHSKAALRARRGTPAAATPGVEKQVSDALAPLDMMPMPPAPDAGKRRVRDRYIRARFGGAIANSAELAETENVIRVARLYFDEGRINRAQELLHLAIEQAPAERSLRLAELEIAYLACEEETYVACARGFHATFGESDEWPEIARLGRGLAPAETLFGTGGPPRPHAHYGPWPDTPNWIQASWDLTSEVLAAELHRGLAVDRAP